MHRRPILLFALLSILAGSSDLIAQERDLVSMVREYYATFAAPTFDVDRLMEFYAPDVRFEDPTFDIEVAGVDSVRTLYAGIGTPTSSYRDMEWRIDRVVARAPDVAIHGIWSGLFRGKPFEVQFVTLWRVRDGKIMEQKDFFDAIGWEKQVDWQGGG